MTQLAGSCCRAAKTAKALAALTFEEATMKRVLIIALSLCGASAPADAATMALTIVINSPASASITCPVAGTFTSPVPAGTVICPITVAPSNWSGTLSLGGTNAGAFAIAAGASGQTVVVGSAPLTTPGSLSVTINAAP
jgi:hypothetical protein